MKTALPDDTSERISAIINAVACLLEFIVKRMQTSDMWSGNYVLGAYIDLADREIPTVGGDMTTFTGLFT